MLFFPQQNINVEGSSQGQVILCTNECLALWREATKKMILRTRVLAFPEFTKFCWQIRASYVNGDAYFKNLKYLLSAST